VFYAPEYADHADVFVWLITAAGVGAVAALLTYALTSARSFRSQVPLFVTVTGSNVIACAILVPRFGLQGAAMATLAANVIHAVLAASLLARVVWEASTSPREEIRP
jgi:O-antigen/teichoic acid export membrane protein